MPFVLDSSVALAWLLLDESGSDVEALIERLEHDHAIVPAIWSLEVSNALLMVQRRGRIKASELERLLAELEVLPIEAESPIGTGRLSAVIALAKSH